MPELIFSGIIVIVVLIVLSIFFTFFPLGLWISAIAAGVKVSIFTLVGMRLRRVIPSRVINPMIKAHKAGLAVTINQLESHYLAGGNVDRVINALIAAHRANIVSLTFERCAAIDLAGRDVLQAVQMSVNPKVIETPYIAGVAINGIEVKAKARITVRANIERLVGGAGEETVIARVGEGIVSTIGSSESHTVVLENPDRISKTILDKGLDAGTAFEILSIDILDVDIGQNIGANLQTEQAIADKNIAQAKAELTKIRSDILAGKISFSDAALKYSKDYLSGANGGSLGYAFPETYAPQFAQTVVQSKQGVISAPFKTEFGWHILEVTGMRDGDLTAEAYAQKAYEHLVNSQLQDATKDWVKALRKKADIQYFNK